MAEPSDDAVTPAAHSPVAADPAAAAAGAAAAAAAAAAAGREDILRRFHAESPGATSDALARGGTYDRLAALVPPGARVLDLGAGDGYLCERLAARGARPIGADFSHGELGRFQARARAWAAGGAGGVAGGERSPLLAVAARAQELPFAGGTFDAAVCHLAFMLMEDAPAVVAELGRVLAPGAPFFALLGGGPVALPPAEPRVTAAPPAASTAAPAADAFHHFLAIAGPRFRAPRFGDPRARSERGWRELFPADAGWSAPTFERWETDLSGPFDEVWRFLGASYELPRQERGAIRDELAAACAPLTDEQGCVPCRMVTWLGTVRRGPDGRGARGRS